MLELTALIYGVIYIFGAIFFTCFIFYPLPLLSSFDRASHDLRGREFYGKESMSEGGISG